MGGSVAHEFMSINDDGEDELILCDCGYKSNQEVAECILESVHEKPSAEISEVFTGDAKDIDSVCKLLNTDAKHTIKAVAYAIKGENGLVVVFIRGDKEVNEAKLKKVTAKEIVAFSAENDERLCAGNIGPIGLDTTDMIVVFDDSLIGTANMVCGANKKEYHLANVCLERDMKNINFADVAKVQEGEICPVCKKGKLKIVHGIEIGNIFQLGTKYTKSMDMKIKMPDESEINPIMGCYGIGVGRALACVIEDNHDEYGIIMPKTIAPYKVHICPLRLDNESVKEISEKLYNELLNLGIECIYDDRDVSAGNKFADADLVGMPVRLVVSPKGLEQNTVEIKDRTTGEVVKTEPEKAIETILSLLK